MWRNNYLKAYERLVTRGRIEAMAKKNKGKGKHSREARLKQLAEQDDNERTADNGEGVNAPSIDEGAHEDAGKTVRSTLRIPEIKSTSVPSGVIAATAAPKPTEAIQAGGYRAIDDAEDQFAGFDVDSAGYPLEVAPASAGSFVAADFSDMPTRRKRKALKVFGITMGVIICLVLVAYVAGAVVFMGRFLPNTFIGDHDISLKTDKEVAELLDGTVAAYKLDVVGNGFSYNASGEDIGLDIDSKGVVAGMHDDLDAWSWPLLIIEPSHDESARLVVTYKKDDLEKKVAKKVKKFNKDAKAPVNATIVYDDVKDKYVVQSEEIGDQLNADAVNASVAEAVSVMQPTLVLSTDHLLQPTVFSTDEKLIESAELASGMVSAEITLNLNGQTVGEVDGSKLSEFISINDELAVKFNNKDLQNWVEELADGYDTIGTERHYTRADGKAITVKGGSYGWEVDTEATKEAILDAIKVGKKTEVDIPCISTADVFSAPGERDWGNRYLDVDISEQHVRFYGKNGKIIWETDFISGAPDGKRDTWEGVWYINNKESPSTLIGYTDTGKKEYETEVKYWMPFEGNGIGFHDAPWQPDFGGNMYAEGYGSHGCVNLSSADAQELYGIIEIGDVVVVHS